MFWKIWYFFLGFHNQLDVELRSFSSTTATFLEINAPQLCIYLFCTCRYLQPAGLSLSISDFHSKWYLNAFAGDCFYMAIFFPLAMFAYIYSKLMMKNWVDELFTSDHILSCTTSFCRGTLCKRSLSLSLSFEWAHFLPCRKAKVKWSWHWQGPICKTGFIGGLVVTIDLPCPTYSNKGQLDGFFYELQISEPTAPKGRCFEPNIWRNLKSHNHPNIFFCSEGL